jgi:RNA polymerase sigma-70 factor (sigma-E family)
VKAPDEAEFRAYAAARMRPLRRTAYLLCGDWHQAEDAVQVVLAKLYAHWDRVDRRDALDGYVRTMLIRATLEHRRRLWWRRELTTSAVPDVVATAPVDPEERIVLIQALAKLPPRQRAVVVLRFWEDLDVAQTAAALGCSEGTVKSQTSHGLTALRSLLTETHPAEGKTS